MEKASFNGISVSSNCTQLNEVGKKLPIYSTQWVMKKRGWPFNKSTGNITDMLGG